MPTRPSPFHGVEQSLGAAFGEIEGWEVPLRFDRAAERIEQARRGAGLVSLVPNARLKVTGGDRIDLLQRLSTNDLRALAPGRAIATIFANAKGRIVDRVHLFDRGETLVALGAPAGRRRIPDWIESFTFSEDVHVTDLTGETAAFALTGPAARAIVREMAGVDPGSASERFFDLPIDGVTTLIAPWDELPSAWIFVAENPGSAEVHARALEAGRAHGLVLLGADEAEVLRVEAGIPADGHELTEDWNPWEIRLETSFSLTKGCYTGQEVIARLATYDKVQRRLVGLRIDAPEPPALPAKVYEDGSGAGKEIGTPGREIGMVTSAVRASGGVAGLAVGGGAAGLAGSGGEGVVGLGVAALAVVRVAYEEPGTPVAVGEERLPATVTGSPIRS